MKHLYLININNNNYIFFYFYYIDHFAENVILDLPEDNLVIFEPTAIVKYLLKEKINGLNAKDLAIVNSWVEYDEFTLSKVLSKDSTENPDAALEKIENALKSNNKQLGKVYNTFNL